MYTKNPLVSLLAASTLTGTTLAANSFRNRRAEAAKLDARAMETNWVTVIETAWVTAGQEVTASTYSFDKAVQPTTDVSTTSVAVATTSLSSVSVASTTTTVAAVPTTTTWSTSVSVAPTTTTSTTTTSSTSVSSAVTTSAPVENILAQAQAQALAVTSILPTTLHTATTTTSASSTSTSTSTSSSTKRGLAYNDASLLNAFFSQRSFSWTYNWGASAGPVSVVTEFVPMLWGASSTYTSGWASAADTAINNGSTHLLSFNEPDILSQSNLTPAEAVAAHITHMNPYSSKAKIGAPATSNSNLDGEGNAWLKEFITACDAAGCVVDFCVTHWYASYDAADSLYTHLAEVREICGDDREIWLTEFAPTGTTEQAVSFMSENLSKLDELSYLARYSYFYAAIPNMMTSSTVLNGIGSAYV